VKRIVVAMILGAVPAGPATASGVWKAGVARVKITPEQPMWMSGYASRTRPAEGTLHDLWAKALALEDPAGRRAVLVTMDLVGIDRGLSVAVCRELRAKHRLPREAVLLAASHTHCGPVVRSNLPAMYDLDATQRQRVRDYAEALQAKLVQVGGAALANLAPARLAWGTGKAAFAVNRRANAEKDVPQLQWAKLLRGPVDHDVPVLRVTDAAGGKLEAVVFGYACHATVMSFYRWCGDYPGFAQIELEKAYPGATALFWAGCGADQNPLPRRSLALAEGYGRQLAEAVRDVLRGGRLQDVRGNLTAAYREVDLPFADLPSRDRLLRDAQSQDRYAAARAKLLLEELRAKGSLSGSYPYPVQAWRLGDDLTWVALGGEVVVDFAIRLKKELRPGKTWVAGYANDVMAYIPSLRVLKEGGYEGGGAMVYYGLPAVWAPQVEERIVEAVHGQVKGLGVGNAER
jgi:hypothetical protein